MGEQPARRGAKRSETLSRGLRRHVASNWWWCLLHNQRIQRQLACGLHQDRETPFLLVSIPRFLFVVTAFARVERAIHAWMGCSFMGEAKQHKMSWADYRTFRHRLATTMVALASDESILAHGHH